MKVIIKIGRQSVVSHHVARKLLRNSALWIFNRGIFNDLSTGQFGHSEVVIMVIIIVIIMVIIMVMTMMDILVVAMVAPGQWHLPTMRAPGTV